MQDKGVVLLLGDFLTLTDNFQSPILTAVGFPSLRVSFTPQSKAQPDPGSLLGSHSAELPPSLFLPASLAGSDFPSPLCLDLPSWSEAPGPLPAWLPGSSFREDGD